MTTPNGTTVTDEQQEKLDNDRFQELNKKPETERTDDEKKELFDLKDKYGKRMQKRIDSMTAKQRALEEENERIRLEMEELKRKESKAEEKIPEALKEETIDIGGKKYFTDQALIAQVKSGEITEDEAYAYQRRRDKEEIKFDLRREQEDESRKREEINIRKEDSDKVLHEYPAFSKKHPDFNSEDPLYKLANELYTEGYAANPRGLSLAIKRAKEILRISDTPIDGSDDHEIESSGAPERHSNGKKEVVLNEHEKAAAISMFTRGDVINPKTNRPYTESEAIAKGLLAKKARLQRG